MTASEHAAAEPAIVPISTGAADSTASFVAIIGTAMLSMSSTSAAIRGRRGSRFGRARL